MKIQSFSDVITNSSSELFIIRNPKEKGDKITEFLQGVYELLERDIDDDMEIGPAGSSGIARAKECGYTVKKGDLLIWSTSDNSIPLGIINLIEGLPSLFNISYYSVERHHLG